MERCNDTKRVLNYCRDALAEINNDDPTGPTWERRWASLIALLRTACETLEREAPAYWDQHMKRPNANVKGRDPRKNWSPDIFGKFIQTDANLFLHEGKLTTGQSAMVGIQGVSCQALVAGQQASPTPSQSMPWTKISYHFNSGHYVDRDPRNIAEEAIEWLQKQIELAEK